MDKSKINWCIFWLPEAPERRFTGHLEVIPGKLPRLTLVVEHGNDALLREDISVLHGYGETGPKLSLCQVSKWACTQVSGFQKVSYSAGKLLEGVHLTDFEQTEFSKFRYAIQHLDTWYGNSGFHSPKHEEKNIVLQFTLPEQKSFQLSSGWKLTFDFGVTSSTGNLSQGIKQKTIAVLEKDKPFTYREATTLSDALRGLIHFSCLSKVFLKSLSAFRPDDMQGDASFSFPNEIKIFGGFLRKKEDESKTPYDFIYRMADLPAPFESFFDRWVEFCRAFSEPLGCYFNTVYHNLTSKLQLAAITQGLESFHAIKTNDRSSTLRERILALTQQHHSIATWAFGSDLDEFAQTVADNRNYHTHYDPKYLAKGRLKNSKDLLLLNESLKVLFRLSVLAELGITKDPHNILRRYYPHRVVSYE